MTTELKPCPFCGSAPKIERMGREEYISCSRECCAAESLCCPSEDEWNRRVEVERMASVTDEMVESGYAAYCKRIGLHRTGDRDYLGKSAFREALLAVLSPVKKDD